MENETISLSPELDKAYVYWKKEKSLEQFAKVQNNGAKSVDSLLSKVKRNIEQLGNKDFKLANITDSARCAILFDSYAEIADFLKCFKQQMPLMQGWVSRNNTGYKGIHMSFEVDGIGVEVQASTFKAWPYKLVAEEFYAKWRNFNQKEEFDKVVGLKNKLEELKLKKQNNNNSVSDKEIEEAEQLFINQKEYFKGKLAEQQQELADSQKLFSELYQDGDFEKNEIEIESTLLSYEIESEKNESTKVEYSETARHNKEVISKAIELDENGKVIESNILPKLIELNQVANKVQDCLVANVNSTLENMNNKNVFVQKLDPNNIKVLQYKEISADLLGMNKKFIDNEIKSGKLNEKFVTNNIRDFSGKVNKLIKSVVNYAEKNKIFNLSSNEIIKSFYQSKVDKVNSDNASEKHSPQKNSQEVFNEEGKKFVEGLKNKVQDDEKQIQKI